LDLQLEGQSAIITGSSKGLGLATAKALVAEGCRVCICARGKEGLDRATAELTSIRGDGMVLAVATDVTRADGAARVVDSALEAFGGIDILINNVATAKGAGILDTPDDVWQDAVDQTLFPAVRMSRLAVPHMKQRGGGSIVMVASIWGRESGGRMTYNAVKAAEISLAKSMAQQLAVDNIRVNSVAPGSILFAGGSWDQRQKSDPDGIAEFVRRELPFGRFGRPDEVGAVIAFLVSPKASWISGSCVPVDGCQSRSLI
jgi:3-oxoacyl-[acyl-carrier protein] reductase